MVFAPIRRGYHLAWDGVRRLAGLLSGRLGYAAAVGILGCYVYLGLEPFRWNPSYLVPNGAYLTGQGTLRTPTKGLVNAGNHPIWAKPATQSNTLRLRLRLRALGTDGMIFAYSDWGSEFVMCVTVEQQGPDLVVGLRTRDLPPRRRHRLTCPGVFDDPGWHDIEFSVAGDVARLVVDGKPAVTEPLCERPLAEWDISNGIGVTLANLVSGKRPWLGEIAACVVESGEARVDYLNAAILDIPDYFWVDYKHHLWPRLYLNWEVVANFVCFLPFGFILGSLKGARGSFLFAVCFCSAASLSVEVAQFFFDRVMSANDWILNTSGAAVGALIARRCFRPAPGVQEPGRWGSAAAVPMPAADKDLVS